MSFYLRSHGMYREGTSYRKRHHHAKKQKSQKELDREAWREHKGFRKDKQKAGFWGWGGPAKDACIKKGHHAHRQWIRQNLNKGNYDVFWDKEIDRFIDCWDWT